MAQLARFSTRSAKSSTLFLRAERFAWIGEKKKFFRFMFSKAESVPQFTSPHLGIDMLLEAQLLTFFLWSVRLSRVLYNYIILIKQY